MLHDTEANEGILRERKLTDTKRSQFREDGPQHILLRMPLMKGSEKAKVTVHMTERRPPCHKDSYGPRLRNRTQSKCIMVASSQHSTTLLTYQYS